MGVWRRRSAGCLSMAISVCVEGVAGRFLLFLRGRGWTSISLRTEEGGTCDASSSFFFTHAESSSPQTRQNLLCGRKSPFSKRAPQRSQKRTIDGRRLLWSCTPIPNSPIPTQIVDLTVPPTTDKICSKTKRTHHPREFTPNHSASFLVFH
jgi:hypothetical protein